MARSRSNKRQQRDLNAIQSKGMGAIALGIGFLLMPFFLGTSPMLKAFSAGLRVPGWIVLTIGLALLGLHHILKRKVDGTGVISTSPGLNDRREPVMSSCADTGRNSSSATVVMPSPDTHWSPAVFAAIEWRRFEAVCELLFGQAGFETRSQSHGADGGVDIWLYSRNAEGPAAVVQCKHWQGKAVGVKELREFYGVMASHKLARGTYATTSTYTADAAQFAKANGINALDGNGLLALIAKRTPEQQQALLAVAYEGDYWRPTCASCGVKMVERKPAKGGAGFWGCSNYPRCKSILPMVAGLR